MKLKAIIREEVKVTDKSIIVEFNGDEKKQHFEVKCLFSPYYKEMQKWDVWELNIKMESEIFTEPKNGQKSYFTHLICIRLNLFIFQDQKKRIGKKKEKIISNYL